MDRWFHSIPVVTRTYLAISAVVTVVVSLEIASPFSLYFNPRLVFDRYEVWRVFTNFFYFDQFSLNFVFHMHFLYVYWSSLERNFFDGKTADFVFMLLVGSLMLLLLGCFIPVPFLGFSLVFMVVYIWSRHNSTQIVPILWFAIPAPWLPYFLALLSLMLGGSPTIDLMGILVGHLYYSFREVLPKYLTTSHETTWLPTPAFFKRIFDRPRVEGDRPHIQ